MQRILEHFSLVIGQPAFLGFILLFAVLWMLVNIVLHQFGIAEFDPAPFFWLQGIVGLGVLLTATVVLTEQKAAKLIDLLEKLRRDLPNVRDRNDPEAATLHQR